MRRTVLAIDDNEDTLELLSIGLTRYGYDVVTAASGQEGYRQFLEKRFDAILCDIMMPLLDGYNICQLVRARNATIPFLFLTAKSQAGDISESLLAGANGFITKPVDLAYIKDQLDDLIRKSAP